MGRSSERDKNRIMSDLRKISSNFENQFCPPIRLSRLRALENFFSVVQFCLPGSGTTGLIEPDPVPDQEPDPHFKAGDCTVKKG